MVRALVVLLILIPLAVIVWLMVSAKGVAPHARLRPDAAQNPTCQTELLGGLATLGRDLGLPVVFTPTDTDTLATTGALDSTYARDAVRHTASFGLDLVEPDGCSLRMWATRAETPASTRQTSGNFGSVYLPACRCDE